jgi:surfeit locus 1 family protein
MSGAAAAWPRAAQRLQATDKLSTEAALSRTLSLIVAAVLGFVMLCTLGAWQLERLQWKTSLIAERKAELAAAPVALATVLSETGSGKTVDYRPVRLTGRFIGGKDLRLFSTAYGPGWEIVSPFLTDDGVLVMVDRGFLPESSGREIAAPPPPATPLALSGFARQPPARKAAFAPANDAGRNRWFWWDLPAMAAASGGSQAGSIAPVYVQVAGTPVGGSDAPRPVVPVVAIPNNHLGYALTWFGLALALAVMAVLAVREARRSGRA